jgi:hypothetical protein
VFENQLIIKILLIIGFAIFAAILLLPGNGARHLAVRRLTLLFVFSCAVAAVAFPALVNSLANFVGVGRGTDLILYALVVVYVGNSIAASRRHRQMERDVTALARALALLDARQER